MLRSVFVMTLGFKFRIRLPTSRFCSLRFQITGFVTPISFVRVSTTLVVYVKSKTLNKLVPSQIRNKKMLIMESVPPHTVG